MYISAEGAQAQIKRMEVLSHNLANVNTPGFKRDVASFQARFAEAIERGQSQTGVGLPEDVGGGVLVHSIQTDFAPGAMQTTGRELDMAIVGEGFFQVRTPEGTFLTRAGNFTRGLTGELETEQGFQVLNQSGNPISLAEGWRLTEDGGIEVPGSGKTLLAIVRPQSLDDLTRIGQNLFATDRPLEALPAGERQIRGGVLEMSAVNSTSSMMELIETSRAIEANMRLIQNQDHMLSSLISRVLYR